MRERRGDAQPTARLVSTKGVEMNRRLSRFIFAAASVFALCGLIATAAAARPLPQTEPGDTLDPRTYSPDSQLFLVVHAIGVQKYTCQSIGSHFLNFASGRPVWQLNDGSSVEAARRQSGDGGTGNIPWLLLQAVVTSA